MFLRSKIQNKIKNSYVSDNDLLNFYSDAEFLSILNSNIESSFTSPEITTFGVLNDTAYGDNKWAGGILAPNGKIYGIPSDSTVVIEIDPETHTYSTFGSLPNSADKYRGGVLAPNGKIYGIPYNADSILEIDLETKTVSTFGQGLFSNVANGYSGGVLADNGKIYAFPFYASFILEIDPLTKSVRQFQNYGTSPYKFNGQVRSANGSIYSIPFSFSFSSKLDSNLALSNHGNIPSDYKWWGGLLGKDGHIYGAPSYYPSILEIDPTSNSVSTFGNAQLGSGYWKYSRGAIAPNGRLYFIPCWYSGSNVLVLDTDTKTLGNYTFSQNAVFFTWVGGTLAPNGKIYSLPRSGTSILCIDTKTTKKFPLKLCLDPRLNYF